MTIKKHRHIKLWVVVTVIIVFCTFFTGYNGKLSAGNEETYEGLKVFSDIIQIIEKNYVDEVDSKKLIEKAIQGMVRSLDPHSTLLLPEAFEELNIDTSGKFTGIGIHITMRDGFVTVISPIEGTPAAKAGIKALDRIIKVDGKTVSELRPAVKMMRGPKGTSVAITISRKGVKEPIEFKMVRDVIPIESVRASFLKPGYGYIRITNFSSNTTKDLKNALEKLASSKTQLKGLVLDFRDNGGGLLDQSIKVADLFIENGVILSVKGRYKRDEKVIRALPKNKKYNYPIVALINGGSASASEIVVGALQDHKRALVLGTTSFGKGSVQTVERLDNGYGLKLTIARYYTPSGRSIQAKGIEPDIVVKKRFIEEDAEDEDVRIKEKDLKNHLDAQAEKDDKDKEKKIHDRKLKTIFRVGEISAEDMKHDNQVVRALEILISYDIFKDMKK